MADLKTTQEVTRSPIAGDEYVRLATSGANWKATLVSIMNALALPGVISGSGGGTANFLRADGTWAAPSGGTGAPGGSTLQIQYNNAGSFAGMSGSSWDNANGKLIVGGTHGEFEVQATSDSNGAVFNLNYTKAAAAASNDRLGEFHFYGDNSSNTNGQYCAIYAESPIVTAGAECGRLLMNVTEGGFGNVRQIFDYNGNTGILTFNVSTNYAFNTGATVKVTMDDTNGLASRWIASSAPNATANVRIGLSSSSKPIIVLNESAAFSWAFDSLSGDLRLIKNAASVPVTITQTNSVVLGPGALATNATGGFVYIPTCAGPPTGVPVAQAGTVPMVYDTTNNKLYVYNGGWKGGTAPGTWS